MIGLRRRVGRAPAAIEKLDGIDLVGVCDTDRRAARGRAVRRTRSPTTASCSTPYARTWCTCARRTTSTSRVAIDCLDARRRTCWSRSRSRTPSRGRPADRGGRGASGRQDRGLPAEPLQPGRPGRPRPAPRASSAPVRGGSATVLWHRDAGLLPGPARGAAGRTRSGGGVADQPGHPHARPDGVAARRRRRRARPGRTVRPRRRSTSRTPRTCCSTTPAGRAASFFATVDQRRRLAGDHRDRHRAGDAADPRRPDRQPRRRAHRDGRRTGGQHRTGAPTGAPRTSCSSPTSTARWPTRNRSGSARRRAPARLRLIHQIYRQNSLTRKDRRRCGPSPDSSTRSRPTSPSSAGWRPASA